MDWEHDVHVNLMAHSAFNVAQRTNYLSARDICDFLSICPNVFMSVLLWISKTNLYQWNRWELCQFLQVLCVIWCLHHWNAGGQSPQIFLASLCPSRCTQTHTQIHRELQVAMAIWWEGDMIEWLRFDCHSVLHSHDFDFHITNLMSLLLFLVTTEPVKIYSTAAKHGFIHGEVSLFLCCWKSHFQRSWCCLSLVFHLHFVIVEADTATAPS